MLLNNFKTAFDRTGTTPVARKTNFIGMLLRGEPLQEFDELESQNSGTKNYHLKHIQEGLLSYLLPINALYNQKRAMRHAMCKTLNIPFKRFTTQLTCLNNHLLLFPGSSNTKNTAPKELNDILLLSVTKLQAKKSYLQGWDFEGESYKDTCDMFECIEVSEQVYE